MVNPTPDRRNSRSLRSPRPVSSPGVLVGTLLALVLGGTGAIAQAPTSPTPEPAVTETATETAAEEESLEALELPDLQDITERAIQDSMLPGLDLQAPLQLLDALNILSDSLEEGLEIPCRFDGARANHNNIREEGLTPPSLWLPQAWIGGKVIQGWYVYEAVGSAEGSAEETEGSEDAALPWVELVINGQPWQNLDYLSRYRSLELVGRSAHRFGYRLRVCDQQKRVVALYACGLEGEGGGGAPCRVLLRGGVSARLNRNPFGF